MFNNNFNDENKNQNTTPENNPNPYTSQSTNPYAQQNTSYTSQTNSTNKTTPGTEGQPQNGYQYYNYNQEQKATEVNYYPAPDVTNKKRGVGLKVLCVALAVAFVSVTSIGIYQGILDTNSTLKALESSSPSSGVSSDGSSSTDSGDSGSNDSGSSNENSGLKSMVELASRSNALSIPEIASKVTPSVVGVTSTFKGQNQVVNSPFGQFQVEGKDTTGTGTGIVMSTDGYIITNAHVIYDTEYNMGLASEVSITFNDGDSVVYQASVVGYDVKTDLAVLKVQKNNCVAAEFGDSDELQVGELAVAIGNPLGLELSCSVTTGIVSALNRQINNGNNTMTLLQTDAAINPGNSGGPLVNSYGQVVGINSAKITGTGTEGLGFAIPISTAKPVIDDLINSGYVTGRPLLGFSGTDVSNMPQDIVNYYKLPQGVYVQVLDNQSGAAKGGILVGDVVTGINGQTIASMSELNEVKNTLKPGETVKLTVYRNGETLECSVVLSENTQPTA